jgi:hypothetical protein
MDMAYLSQILWRRHLHRRPKKEPHLRLQTDEIELLTPV